MDAVARASLHKFVLFFFFLSQVFLFFRAAGSIHFITDTLKSEATSPLFYVFFFTFQDELEATLKQ